MFLYLLVEWGVLDGRWRLSSTEAAELTLTEHLCPSFLKLRFPNTPLFLSSDLLSVCLCLTKFLIVVQLLFFCLLMSLCCLYIEDSNNTAVGFHVEFSITVVHCHESWPVFIISCYSSEKTHFVYSMYNSLSVVLQSFFISHYL